MHPCSASVHPRAVLAGVHGGPVQGARPGPLCTPALHPCSASAHPCRRRVRERVQIPLARRDAGVPRHGGGVFLGRRRADGVAEQRLRLRLGLLLRRRRGALHVRRRWRAAAGGAAADDAARCRGCPDSAIRWHQGPPACAPPTRRAEAATPWGVARAQRPGPGGGRARPGGRAARRRGSGAAGAWRGRRRRRAGPRGRAASPPRGGMPFHVPHTFSHDSYPAPLK